MAGAGYKVFADGDVLTAAQVQTFLQDQSVMRFADSSARTTALGTAVAEGMLSYLNDVDEVQVYDGTSWGAVGLPLGTATPTDGQILAFGTATSTWNPTDQLAGIGSNVVMGTTTTTTTTTSATAVDTSCTATITPTSATSKVLILYSAGVLFSREEDQAIIDLYSPNAAGTLVVADLARNRIVPTPNLLFTPASFVYLDSPATTSAKTYTVTLYRDGSAGNVSVQRRQQLILIEVAV